MTNPHPIRRFALALMSAPLLSGLSACSGLWPLSTPPAPAPVAAPVAPPAVAVAPRPVKPPVPQEPDDARPRVQRLANGPPNHTYEIKGETYVPDDTDVPLRETGLASWYGHPFHGRRTASGEVYDMHAMTAAHKTMPLPSYARVRNLKNGREIIVRVNDRGPFYPGRVIDLSRAAARKLRIGGLAKVEVQRLTHDEIRSGAWRQRSSLAARPSADTRVAADTPAARLSADVQATRQSSAAR